MKCGARVNPGGLAVVLFCALFVSAGCEMEERVVSARGGLINMPGAQSGIKNEIEANRRGTAQRSASSEELQPLVDEEGRPIDPLRTQNEDGTVTLISKAPRHVVHHVRRTLIDGELDLLYEQVLSERTKSDYIRARRDPREAIDFMVENKKDILKFLARIRMGELSAGAFLQPRAGGVYTISAKVAPGQLRFTRLDVAWEHGQCRLVLIR